MIILYKTIDVIKDDTSSTHTLLFWLQWGIGLCPAQAVGCMTFVFSEQHYLDLKKKKKLPGILLMFGCFAGSCHFKFTEKCIKQLYNQSVKNICLFGIIINCMVCQYFYSNMSHPNNKLNIWGGSSPKLIEGLKLQHKLFKWQETLYKYTFL